MLNERPNKEKKTYIKYRSDEESKNKVNKQK